MNKETFTASRCTGDIIRLTSGHVLSEGLFCFLGVAKNILHSSYELFHSFNFMDFSSLIPLDFDLISESFQLFHLEKEGKSIYFLVIFIDF